MLASPELLILEGPSPQFSNEPRTSLSTVVSSKIFTTYIACCIAFFGKPYFTTNLFLGLKFKKFLRLPQNCAALSFQNVLHEIPQRCISFFPQLRQQKSITSARVTTYGVSFIISRTKVNFPFCSKTFRRCGHDGQKECYASGLLYNYLDLLKRVLQ